MNNYYNWLIAIVFMSLFLVSCSKDEPEPDAPTIHELEVGHGNEKIGYAGSDLHLEAEIRAPGKIADVRVDIHSHESNGWKFEETFTEGFEGLLNAVFHKHIDIPADALPGEYHLHFIVTDQNGNTAEEEAHLEIRLEEKDITVFDLEVEVEEDGKELHVSAQVNAVNKIAKIEVEVHGGDYEEEHEFTDSEMVGKTSYHFHEHIDISAAPAGPYHIHFKVIDQAGKEREFGEHFDKP